MSHPPSIDDLPPHAAAAARALRLLPAGSGTTDVFDVVARVAGVAAGFFGEVSGDARSFCGHAVRLPSPLFSAWLATPDVLFRQTLEPIIAAGDGELLLAANTVSASMAEQMPVLAALDSAGLGAAAGYKLFQRGRPPLRSEHLIMGLFKERGAALSEEDRAMLRLVHPSLCEAVARAALPFVSDVPILRQILEQDDAGHVCLSPGGGLIEVNRRAAQLAARYGPLAGLDHGREMVADLARQAVTRHSRRPWRLLSLRDEGVLTVQTYRLTRESHILPTDVMLVVLREEALPSTPTLTRAERRIALLLACTALSYKEIAKAANVSLGTVRVHVWRIYDKLGVESREELALQLRAPLS